MSIIDRSHREPRHLVPVEAPGGLLARDEDATDTSLERAPERIEGHVLERPLEHTGAGVASAPEGSLVGDVRVWQIASEDRGPGAAPQRANVAYAPKGTRLFAGGAPGPLQLRGYLEQDRFGICAPSPRQAHAPQASRDDEQ